MNVQDVYELILFIAGKNNGQGYETSDEFNRSINTAQDEWLSSLLDNPLQYQPGRPIPRYQYSMNQNIRQSISVLIGPPTTLTVDANGNANYPSDYLATDAMYDANLKKIRFVPQGKLSSYLESVIDPIASNPIFLLQSEKFQFYPKSIGTALLSYVIYPDPIVYGTVPDSNGREVYNPGTSTDPMWRDTDMMNIIGRALRMTGINLQDAAISQYATELKTTGL